MDKSVKAHVLQMMKDFMDKDTSDMLMGGKEPKGATIEIVSAKPVEGKESLSDILGSDPMEGNDKESYADDMEDLVNCDHDSDDKEEYVRKPAKGVKSTRFL
jgi:hypothetical protein